MTQTVADRLAALGLTLPTPPAPAAAYAPFAVHGSVAHIAGQLPMENGALAAKGRLGDDMGVAEGAAAARICAINVIAQIKAACGGDLERVARVLKLNVFVASAPDFTDQPLVANGASELMAAVFGEAGVHARAAVGVAALPFGAAVEVDAVVALR